MKTSVFLILLTFLGCSSGHHNEDYSTIINEADKMIIHYTDDGTNVELSDKDLETFKNILTSNIEVEFIRKFRSDIGIDIYHGSNRLAYFKIYYDKNNGFVNFYYDKKSFGFKMNYGIGRFLDEMKRTDGNSG